MFLEYAEFELTLRLNEHSANCFSVVVPRETSVLSLVIRTNSVDAQRDVAIGLVVSHRVLPRGC